MGIPTIHLFLVGGRPDGPCQFCGRPASAKAGWHRGVSFNVCRTHMWDLSRWNDLHHIVRGECAGNPEHALAELVKTGSQLFALLVSAAES